VAVKPFTDGRPDISESDDPDSKWSVSTLVAHTVTTGWRSILLEASQASSRCSFEIVL